MQPYSTTSFAPGWHHVPSPLATGHSNLSPAHQQQYGASYSSPRGAKRSRSISREAEMDIDPRRLRSSLPHIQTSSCLSSLPTPPLSSSSSMSSGGSSASSFSSFPRSFSMQNWQPSSTGLPMLYASPSDMPTSHLLRSSKGPQHLGPEDVANYANQGFATPAIRGEHLDCQQPKSEHRGRDMMTRSYSGMIHNYIPTSTSIPSANLRASSIPTPPPAPTLDAQQLQLPVTPETQQPLVEGLLGTSLLAIESIWSSSTSQTSEKSSGSDSKVLPLKYFIRETLRRSRSSVPTLQVALYYLHRARVVIRERVLLAEKAKAHFALLSAQRKQEQEKQFADVGFATPPGSPTEEFTRAASEVLATSRDPVVCGRRMFLASLICASKFLQDRNYSNRAWSRLSGLPVNEINANERSFLDVLGYELFIKPETFTSWNARIHKLAVENEAKILRLSASPRSTNGTRISLKRANTEYLPGPEAVNQRFSSANSPSYGSTRSALHKSATQLDLTRRASLATSVPGSQPYSPLPASRRASEAYRYPFPAQPCLPERRGSVLPFGPSTPVHLEHLSRPSLSRKFSSSTPIDVY